MLFNNLKYTRNCPPITVWLRKKWGIPRRYSNKYYGLLQPTCRCLVLAWQDKAVLCTRCRCGFSLPPSVNYEQIGRCTLRREKKTVCVFWIIERGGNSDFIVIICCVRNEYFILLCEMLSVDSVDDCVSSYSNNTVPPGQQQGLAHQIFVCWHIRCNNNPASATMYLHEVFAFFIHFIENIECNPDSTDVLQQKGLAK